MLDCEWNVTDFRCVIDLVGCNRLRVECDRLRGIYNITAGTIDWGWNMTGFEGYLIDCRELLIDCEWNVADCERNVIDC